MLTDEQLIDIFRVRERLEAYRNKIQPYPPLEPYVEKVPETPQYRGLSNKEREEFNQLKANFLYLDKKFNNLERELKPLLDKEKKKDKDLFTIKGYGE